MRPTLALLPSCWTTPRLQIEDASPTEIPCLHTIFNACAYVEPWDPTFRLVAVDELSLVVAQSLANDDYNRRFKLQCVHDRVNCQPVGYFHMFYGMPQPDTIWLSMFCIHPDYQRLAYGHEIVEGLSDRLSLLGYAAIWLRVYLKNWPALRFWIDQGFTTIIEFEGDPVLTPDGHASLKLEKRLPQPLLATFSR